MVDPDAIVGELSVGLQQRVEILKALVRGAEILVLDEPTAVLTPAEADQLFEMLRVLKRENKTIIFITHKLREIMIFDRPRVGHAARRDGRDLRYRQHLAARARRRDGRAQGHPQGSKKARRIQARLRWKREILWCAMTAASLASTAFRSYCARARFSAWPASPATDSPNFSRRSPASAPLSSGEILIEGEPIPAQKRNPHGERLLGVGHVPEDRHRVGLVMPFEACESAMLGFHREPVYGKGFFYDRKAIIADADEKMESFDVRPRAPLLKTANFSGGNQQKLVLAREIERNPKILLVGQPTRGVDIGAIEFIHKRIVAQRDAGKAVLLVSVELDEIFALSDRIIVLCGGRITGERRPEETNAQDLGLLMAGVSERAA